MSIQGLVNPTATQQAAYLRDLKAISPDLVKNQEQAVRHGRDVCLNLMNGPEAVMSNTAKSEAVSTAVARRIITAAKRDFCP